MALFSSSDASRKLTKRRRRLKDTLVLLSGNVGGLAETIHASVSVSPEIAARVEKPVTELDFVAAVPSRYWYSTSKTTQDSEVNDQEALKPRDD